MEEQRVFNENDEIENFIYTNRGTGFFINSFGYFITAKHVLEDSRDIGNYKVLYKGEYYSIFKIESIFYKNNPTDITMFKVSVSEDNINFIHIQKINENRVKGNVSISGYSNDEQKIKLEKFYIHSTHNSIFKIKNEQDLAIRKGCSGSPIFKEIDDYTTQLVGVMSSTYKGDKVINYISSINLVKKINYDIENFKIKQIKFLPKCKETSFITKVRLLFCKKDGKPKLFRTLHREVEHTFIGLEYDLKKNYETFSLEQKRAKIRQILVRFKRVFDIVAGDVSIHIKLIERYDPKQRKAFSQTISRVSSTREEDYDIPRQSKEEFVISNEIDIKELERKQKFYNARNETLDTSSNKKPQKVNSAYNQVIYGTSKYWLCNDLDFATKQNKYFSSSSNYQKYYNSLVIFVIADKDMENNPIPIDKIKGLLIVDSKDKGSFNKDYIKEIGGYLTHKLNRLLSPEYFENFFGTCKSN